MSEYFNLIYGVFGIRTIKNKDHIFLYDFTQTELEACIKADIIESSEMTLNNNVKAIQIVECVIKSEEAANILYDALERFISDGTEMWLDDWAKRDDVTFTIMQSHECE